MQGFSKDELSELLTTSGYMNDPLFPLRWEASTLAKCNKAYLRCEHLWGVREHNRRKRTAYAEMAEKK